MRRLLTAALILVGLLTTAATAQARRSVPRGWLGVMVGPELVSRPDIVPSEFRKIRASGAESIRVVVDWSAAQTTAHGPIDFSGTDRIVRSAARNHLRVLPVVVSAPRWASDDHHGVHTHMLTPEHPADYAGYVAALVARYGSKGTFWRANRSLPKTPITLWQIWNEPSLPSFWGRKGSHKGQKHGCAHQPWVRSFKPLLRASAKAIRRADPKARVLLPGFPNYSWASVCALYRAGAAKYFDAVAIHPYSRQVKGVVEAVGLMRRTMNRFGGRKTPLYLTELSWPASWKKVIDPGFSVTAKGQVERIKAALPALARKRRAWHIGGVYWYTWLSDFDRSWQQPFRFSGLREVSPRSGKLSNRPGLKAFKAEAHRLEH
jgi:hypothetical protein